MKIRNWLNELNEYLRVKYATILFGPCLWIVPREFTMLAVSFVFLNILDLYVTLSYVDGVKIVEGNPIFNFVMGVGYQFAAWLKMLVTLFVVYCFAILQFSDVPRARAGLMAAVAFMVILNLWNLAILELA